MHPSCENLNDDPVESTFFFQDDGEAFVKDARNDACSRNVFRHEDLKDSVELTKVRDHFIFNIESVGAVPPKDLVPMALDVLIAKCDYFIDILEKCGE